MNRRLFFALWPTPEVAGAIAAVRDTCPIRGRTVRTDKLHLTLAFLGAVEAAAVDPLLAAAGRIAVPAFSLELARIGYFARPGIAWLGPLTVPAGLAALVGEVETACAAAGVGPARRRFRPHVTLARRAPRPAPARTTEVVSWPVTAFNLVESSQVEGRSVYRDLGRWPLAV